MIMAYDNWYTPEPPPRKRVLFVCRDLVMAAQLRSDLADQNLTTIAPDLECHEENFDVIVMCFEPTTSAEQTWFHTHVKPKLNVNGTIYWST